MSAIFGIIYKDGKPAEQRVADILHASISHRATDGKGTWMEANVVLGHCLLKTYPQQEFEKQPQKQDSCIITADARLDNRSDLATWFGIDKQLLAITSDPVLILHAYQRWGKDCVKYLEGEFAFAIWDNLKKECFFARDRVGIRPLFYSEANGTLVFGSEIKSLFEYTFTFPTLLVAETINWTKHQKPVILFLLTILESDEESSALNSAFKFADFLYFKG